MDHIALVKALVRIVVFGPYQKLQLKLRALDLTASVQILSQVRFNHYKKIPIVSEPKFGQTNKWRHDSLPTLDLIVCDISNKTKLS